ncbi:MAG: hypothetical protein QNL04_04315 [SAR324 cluster bacterium]|nr:hypothetical protein [SAR324 cluster bacterium]
MNKISTPAPVQAKLDRPSAQNDVKEGLKNANTKNVEAKNAPALKKTEETSAKSEKKETEVSEYLKAISRLENKIKTDDLSEEDLEKTLTKLEEKIMSLSPQQKRSLRKLEFFLQGNIENLTELKDHLTEVFNDPLKQKEGIEFLKDPKFMAILESKNDDMPKTYGPTLGKTAIETTPKAAESTPKAS